MARPLSPEKRNALLQSATQAIAEQGVLATTSGIAKGAGVAEGTLFTYFESKDSLLQQLYLHHKQSLADAMMPAFPHSSSHRARLQHVFDTYVGWGLQNTEGRLAVARLTASGLLAPATKAEGMAPFLAVTEMMDDAVAQRVFVQAPVDFLFCVIEDIANTTITFVERHPESAERFAQLGFDTVWKAITV